VTGFEAILFVLLLILCAGAAVGVHAAYRNGCNDGYCASKEPEHPGYRKAVQILKERWPEIERRIREETPEDMPYWLVGRMVQGKYRGRALYATAKPVTMIYQSGHCGIEDKNGVVEVMIEPGVYMLAGADHFVTA
jgi:hypothetical protein